MKHFLVYSLLRVGLFLACLFLAWPLLGLFLSDKNALIWGVVAAAVVSSVLSLVFLTGPRERFADYLEHKAGRAKERFEESRSREDVD